MRLTTRHILLLAFLVMIHHFAYSSELVPVRLQLKWKHQFQFAGYYAAIERGYYRDVGLDVSILEAQPQKTPFDAVFRGEAEFGVCTTDILSSKNKGETPVVLANIFQHSPHIIIAMQESGIRHIHDLAGKKIAAEPGAADLYAILLSEGVSLDKFSVEELDFSIDKFIAGEVDAITAYSTDQIFPLQEAGYELNLIYPTNSGVDFYGDLLFTSQALILSNPALVKKFVAASLKGWSYALSNREELVNLIYNKYSKRHSLNHLRFEAEQTWKLILPEVVEIGYTNPGRWETILEMYKRLGRVDESVTLEGMLYADYQKQPFRIPWRLIIILCSALIIAIAFLSFFYRYNKKLKQEIHKRELIQQQLSETNEVLFRTNKEKDKFFSIIAHDLRSPFTAFLGITQVLLEQIDAMELKEIKYYAENLNKSAKNLYRLLENLLQWSCIKQGLSTPQFTTFSINKTVEDILKMFRIS
ncbi:MAG: ABC transporter substrate-binding protein, partial [Candidatus Cloacimonetes bacterium]|nr:ABC transporter substrate-binding protein [Candidatus Cloacimonadota bacterium]